MSLELEIAICEDEEFYRTRIKDLLIEHLSKKDVLFHVDIFKNGLDFCKDEKNLQKYDVIFLDIKMKEMDGMTTAYTIRKKNQEVDIVFITVMMEHVFEGYRVGALRYIMKNDLEVLLPECLNAMLDKKLRKNPKMEFSFVGGRKTVLLKEILYIESKSHRVYFEGVNEKLYLYGQVSELETKLSDYGFVRTHQSFLVNLEHIEKIKSYRLYLSNGAKIPVTKSRYSEVKERFLRYKEAI